MAITNIKHRGLRKLFTKGHSRRIGAQHQANALKILDFLNAIADIDDCLGVRGFHGLSGDRNGQYAMSVSKNWRIAFSYEDGAVTIEAFVDDH